VRAAAWAAVVVGLGWWGGCGDDDGAPVDLGAPETGPPDLGPADLGRDLGSEMSMCPDRDGDGHADVACGGDDCDDDDARRFPGNTEVCDYDGHDEDCDEATFGDKDVDRDGFVDARCCNGTGPAARCGEDCDDARRNTNPLVPEVCNGRDDDCNGMVDETCATPEPDGGVDGGSDAGLREDLGTVSDAAMDAARPEDVGVDGAPTADMGVLPDGGMEGGADAGSEAGTDAGTVRVTALTLGAVHTCALLSDGTVRCWGRNDSGQLGDGTTTSSPTPVAVMGLGGMATALVAGGDHTCALLSDDTVRCWGRNDSGQLGNGTTTPSPTPVAVMGLGSMATALVAGGDHTCALLADGGVQCWGRNDSGQLGNGTTTPSPTPVAVMGLGGMATALVAGAYHTCALRSDGTVRCWGRNDSGQLGDGSRMNRPTPVPVVDLVGTASTLTAGALHTCAVISDGRVQCWGRNDSGQLGDGTTTRSPTPVAVTGLGGTAAAVEAGGVHTCALLADGHVQCWGSNFCGQLGDGTTTNRSTPTTVTGLGGTAAVVDAGGFHTCALLADGRVQCWGCNDYGQIGDRSRTPRLTPVTAVNLP
jgi:alpha-tubulin suppressor-like RCC1 family protein